MFKSQPPHQASETLLEQPGSDHGGKADHRHASHRPAHRQARHARAPLRSSPTRTTTTLSARTPTRHLTSGFTFVGQFVDHDITFDTTPLSEQQSDPDATTNFRTPRYDLDAIYGRGPNADPQFYDPADRDKFLLVPTYLRQDQDRHPQDASRRSTTCPASAPRPEAHEGKAIIADPRNDQTLIILQLHVAMQMFHNKLVDLMRAERSPPGGGVRVGPPPGPVALPVDGDPRVPARHRGHRPWPTRCTRKSYRGADHQHQVLQADEPRGAPLHPGRVLGGRIPLRPQHHPAPLHRPGLHVRHDTDPVTAYVTVAVSSVPLFEATAHDNNLNGSRPLPPRLKLQWSKFFNVPGEPSDRPARAPVRRHDGRPAVQAAHDGAARLEPPGACSRRGTSSGARRWACPRDSRWLG